MTFQVEVVVDRGMDGGEFLQRLEASEARHRPLSSPERLMGVFGPVVEPAAGFLAICDTDGLDRCAVGSQTSVTIDRGRP